MLTGGQIEESPRVRIFTLLLSGSAHPVFYTEIPIELERGELDDLGRPVRGWATRNLRRIRAALYRAVRRSGPRVRRLWNWLDRRPPPDEALLQVLRQAPTLEVIYPSAFAEKQARYEWNRYLGKRWREHLLTFAWDLLVLPLVGLLMVVPGPNVIGYWFVYRILTHLLAMRGVARVRAGWVPTVFLPAPELNSTLMASSETTEPEVERVAQALGLNYLSLYLRRIAERKSGVSPSDDVSKSEHLAADSEVSLRNP